MWFKNGKRRGLAILLAAAFSLCCLQIPGQALALTTTDSEQTAFLEIHKTAAPGKNASKKSTAADPSVPADARNEAAVSNDVSTPWPQGFLQSELYSRSVVVMDVDSGAVLYAKKPDHRRFPASITKILTAYVALTNCKSLDETVTFSKNAIYKTEGSGIARDVGEKLTLEQCLYAMMLESANECAYAIAEQVGADMGGGYNTFIQKMNQTAKQIGCKKTHFVNPNGLPDQSHYTSAADMARIARLAYSDSTFRKIVSTKSYKIPKTNKNKHSLTCYNHHAMICNNRTNRYLYKWAVGGKTGFTNASWNTLVTYAKKGGKTYVCVVMKSSYDAQYKETKKLLNYCFDHFSSVNVAKKETRYSEEQLKDELTAAGVAKKSVSSVAINKNAAISLPKGADIADTKAVLSWSGSQQPSGQLDYTYGGYPVGTAQIDVTLSGEKTAQQAVSDASAGQSVSVRFFHLVRSNPVISVAAVVVAALIILIAVRIIYVRRERRRRRKRHSGGQKPRW